MPYTMPFCSLLPSRGSVYFNTCCIWAGLVIHFNKQNAAEVSLCQFWTLSSSKACITSCPPPPRTPKLKDRKNHHLPVNSAASLPKTPEACTTQQSYLLTVREGRNIGREIPQFLSQSILPCLNHFQRRFGYSSKWVLHLDLVRISRASFLP